MSDDHDEPKMANPAGEAQNGALRLDFDRRVTVQFRGSIVTSDAGLLAYRELDDALGLSEIAGEHLADARTGKNGRHALVGLLRQSVFGRLAGYEDVNDAQRLRYDPAMRWIVGGKAAKGRPASPSQMGRFETEWLAATGNLSALADLSGQWIDTVNERRPGGDVVLDMDSSVSPTHGDQEQSVWSGHFECTCYHPLFGFNQFGDLERCALRPGNVHSADDWESVLKPVVARYQCMGTRISFRGTEAVRCNRVENSSFAIAAVGDGNMNAPATVRAGTTTEEVRPHDHTAGLSGAFRADSGFTPCQPGGAARPRASKTAGISWRRLESTVIWGIPA